MLRKYLFYVTQNYSFEILRPLQANIIKQGHRIAWLSVGNDIDNSLFHQDEFRLLTIKEAVNFHPDACFIPGNEIPSFISGLKVQVFHGLEWKKKGHFRCFGPQGRFSWTHGGPGNAALGRAGNLFIGPFSLALGARLIFTRPLLVEIVQNILGTHP